MTDIINLPDSAFKDAAPKQTVENIKQILQEHGIRTIEKWNDSKVPYCHSLSITVEGTSFNVNGKGVTEAFALASGYGELMERLQLGYIYKERQQKGNNVSATMEQDIRIPAQALLDRNKKWYTALAGEIYQQTGATMTEEEILAQYTEADGCVLATPCYNAVTGTKEHFPTMLRKTLYATNGCAAGNTMEEAIVQAISEIVERYYKLRILTECPTLPVISEDVLKTYTIAYNIITFLRSNGFRVEILDCSLGTKFPVVCVCIIDQKTGKYHTHFGACPNFEIAVQRTLTECFQGRSIDTITSHEAFSSFNQGSLNLTNLMDELVRGAAEKPASFFMNVSRDSYVQTAGFTGKNNRHLLRECVTFFAEQGYDILVRDCSCLGFPTYQVLIPGISEVFPYRVSPKHNDLQYSNCAVNTLRNPSAAKLEDMMGYLMHISKRQNIKSSNSGGFLAQAKLHAELPLIEENYLMDATMGYIYYTLGRYADAIKYIDRMLASRIDRDVEYLICAKRHLSLLLAKNSPDEIRAVLSYFHQPQTVEKLYACIDANKNILEPFTLHCDLKCSPDCLLINACRKQNTNALVELISRKMQELDPNTMVEKLNNILA
ncbi:MAG: hypothetical protein E7439_07385 [Ruminococcaceae bacterium]|nr:hypothetical protein [Oscillospiraceae bacterium]